ncbi:MAG TPA: DinB family protein [Candidatus Polarisedimenticolia bacterium]|nr:DinB family protein [Candidatus Polarisedimenticolia bacterium]
MALPIVEQLRFTRSEWLRALRGVPEADGAKRVMPMNSISWIVGHLAWHEQRYWLTRLAEKTPVPVLNEIVASGGPATTPPLRDMLRAWRKITKASDPLLDGLAASDLLESLPGSPRRLIGNALRRVTYHYWFHIGEILAIRQMLDHPNRPEFVGNIDDLASYRPEPEA